MEKRDSSGRPEPKVWNAFPILIRDSANDYVTGTAELIVANGNGYLWLGDDNDALLGWISEKQLDAIARRWLHLQSARGRKTESARFERIRRWQDRELRRIMQKSVILGEE
jgi:hypothetical protein